MISGMAHTYEELHKKTVDELRDIAKGLGDDAVKGYTQMNKEHLLPALCKALGIEAHAHHEVKGLDKGKVKAQLRALKAKRGEALGAHDHDLLKQIRRQRHRLNRKIRSATV
jgi:hypothetical protein